ncbi:MAG: GNAT family N-acetyltransferase [Pseudomonadota bacterium]|nr:GNAT family N-acetyltransferase [Pseudomonadota bacterium]
MTPRRLRPGDAHLTDTLRLIRQCFSAMDGRIDPPSSMHLMTLDSLEHTAASAEVWAMGEPPVACVVLTHQPDALYIGKLAVSPERRRQGLAARLIDLGEQRARALGLPSLRLQTRVELIENHSVFISMGFRETARTAHPGYDRPTSITMERAVDSKQRMTP